MTKLLPNRVLRKNFNTTYNTTATSIFRTSYNSKRKIGLIRTFRIWTLERLSTMSRKQNSSYRKTYG